MVHFKMVGGTRDSASERCVVVVMVLLVVLVGIEIRGAKLSMQLTSHAEEEPLLDSSVESLNESLKSSRCVAMLNLSTVSAN